MPPTTVRFPGCPDDFLWSCPEHLDSAVLHSLAPLSVVRLPSSCTKTPVSRIQKVSACLQNVQGYCQTLLLFQTFLQAGEQTGSCFSHTCVSSAPQPMQLHAFLAPLETPISSLAVQGCKSACVYIICRYPSTFFFLGALQHV